MEDIHPIKEAIGVDWLGFTGALLLLGAMVGGVLLFVWWRRNRVSGEVEVEQKQESTQERFERELRRMRMLVDEGKYEEFYERASQVVRRYVGFEIEASAMEMTTSEIGELQKVRSKNELMAVLEQIDVAQFGGIEADREKCLKVLNDVTSYFSKSWK